MNVNDKSAMLRGVLRGACLYAFGALSTAAFADDGDAAKPHADDSSKTARDDAVETVPKWESYGAGMGDVTMEETFFRLSRDFVTTSDEGIHRLGSVPIWPRGELKIGGFRVLPFLREGVTWDDNYYKQPESGSGSGNLGRRSEWTHDNEVGLLADTALMGGRLGISTSIDSIWGIHYGRNSPPDTWDFEGQLGATYHWPSGVWISGGYRYNRSHDATDLPEAAHSPNDFGRSTNGFFVDLGMDRDLFFGSKAQFEVGMQTRSVRADNKTFADLNRKETTVYAKASYPFLGRDTTRIFALASETFNQRDSEAINNGNVFTFNTGIEGTIPLRQGEYRGLRGQVSVGFQRGIYENNKYTQGSQTFIEDSSPHATTIDFIAALQYVMSPKTTLDLRYTHDAEFSFHGNYQIVDRLEWSASHTFTRQLTGRVDAYYEHQSPSGRSPQTPINGIDLSGPAKNVNREGAGIGFRYAVNDWMDFDVSMNVENRNDHTDNSFKNYEGILGVTFYLNALTPRPRPGTDR